MRKWYSFKSSFLKIDFNIFNFNFYLTFTTPGDHVFSGTQWTESSCGVSIVRSGEAMEHGLRDCCRSIRIGKILIQTDDETGKAQVYYSKFPPQINNRIILLMYPILNYGSTVSEAVEVLKNHGVDTSPQCEKGWKPWPYWKTHHATVPNWPSFGKKAGFMMVFISFTERFSIFLVRSRFRPFFSHSAVEWFYSLCSRVRTGLIC